MNKNNFIKTIIITLICAFLGKFLSKIGFLSLIGTLVISLILGIILGFIPKIKETTQKEVGFISNKFLRAGIIFLGFKLNLSQLFKFGIKTLILAVFIVSVVFLINYIILHKFFKEDKELSLLTASGCSICGAAAVMGVSPSINAHKDNQIIAVAIVCILGTVFTLFEVYLNHSNILSLTTVQYAVVSGSSLHEIAHAVAAGNAVKGAEEIAIVTKLARVLMLVPVAIIMGICGSKKCENNSNKKLPIPYFMFGFILTSIIGTFINIPTYLLNLFINIAYISLGMAMAALGISVNFKVIRKKGLKTLLGATIASFLQLIICIITAKIFF